MQKINVLVGAAVFSLLALGIVSEGRADWHDCFPTEVVELNNRIAVKCASPKSFNGTAIWYAAISNSNASLASRFVALASSAILSGKNFMISIPASSATNVAGCLAFDCRTPDAFGVVNK